MLFVLVKLKCEQAGMTQVGEASVCNGVQTTIFKGMGPMSAYRFVQKVWPGLGGIDVTGQGQEFVGCTDDCHSADHCHGALPCL